MVGNGDAATRDVFSSLFFRLCCCWCTPHRRHRPPRPPATIPPFVFRIRFRDWAPGCVPQILALKAPGSGDEMDTIAEGTGGVVSTTQADSEDIVGAVLQASAACRGVEARGSHHCLTPANRAELSSVSMFQPCEAETVLFLYICRACTQPLSDTSYKLFCSVAQHPMLLPR